MDGAFCNYDNDDKMKFLQRAYDAGARNIEMEATVLVAMCKRANVNVAIACVALLNRLDSMDQVTLTKDQLHEYEQRPFHLILAYAKKILNL